MNLRNIRRAVYAGVAAAAFASGNYDACAQAGDTDWRVHSSQEVYGQTEREQREDGSTNMIWGLGASVIGLGGLALLWASIRANSRSLSDSSQEGQREGRDTLTKDFG